MNYIHWLSQIQYSERSLVGNKLFILSQLLQNQCSILPGLVLSDRLWKRFLANLEGELPAIERTSSSNLEDYRMLQSLANRSRQLINRASFSAVWQREISQATRQLNSKQLTLELFASSDGLALSGDLWRSHTCNATPEAIANAIKLVWSELFTARSLLYWHKLGIDIESIKLSILVRPLKTACASGMIEVGRDLIRIAAVWGLEQGILQGDVEPDEYYCYRQTEEIVGQHLGHKNYAYRLAEHNTPLGCLEAYVPPENLAATSVLDPEAIANLLQSTDKILARQPQIKYLTWTAWGERHINPHVYFTRLEDRLTTNLSFANQDLADSSIPPLLTGIGVAPGQVQAPAIVIADLDADTHAIPPGSILVTRAIEPQQLFLLKQVGGIITETGGHTSHGAILARELNIPAVVNVENATKLIQEKTEVLLDGTTGKVYPPVTDRRLAHTTTTQILHPTYPIATKLMVNLSQPESIASAIELPLDGVGLIRSELMLAELLADRTLAQWQESWQKRFIDTLTSFLRQFATAFAPRPVFYRSLDRYAQASNLVGNRGTYSYLIDPALFDLELTALHNLIAEGHTNLNLILPFVRSVEEFKFCYRRIENIGLTAQGSFQVWIMAEVPSTILLLPEYIRAGVRGIAIGTNDLTQLLLGVDRQQTQFSDRALNANHPAMQKAIAQLITTAHDYDIECSICGQAPVEHPDLIDFLVRRGIGAISVEPEAVGRTYQEIARAEKKMLLGELRES